RWPSRRSSSERCLPAARCSSIALIGRGGVATRHGVFDRCVAGLEKLIERLAAHGGVNVQIGNAEDRAEFLQAEKNRPIMDQPLPIAPAQQVALRLGEARFLECTLRIAEESLPVRG